MNSSSRLFPERGTLIGMVHLGALPGAPFHETPLEGLVDAALRDARRLVEAGFEALLVENMGDRPYSARVADPVVTSAMTRVTLALRAEFPRLPLGVQILAGANREALAVASVAGADFVRVEGFAYAAVADEGLIEADAASLLRYRRALGAREIAVLADVRKKHSAHALTADLDLAALVEGALFCGADGVIVTGEATGRPTRLADLRAARGAAGSAPVLVGSGVTPENARDLVPLADGLVVGSWVKREGRWQHPVDPERAARLVGAARAAR